MTRPARHTQPADSGLPSPAGVVASQDQEVVDDGAATQENAAEASTEAVPATLSADDLQRLGRFEAVLAEAEIQRAADAVRLAERDQQIDELLAALGRVRGSRPEQVTIVGGFSQAVAAEAWAMVDPKRTPAEAPKFARSYKVVPTGDSAKKSMPIAVVHNVADESDAKTWYLLKLNVPAGVSLTCNVERLPDSVDA